MATGVESVLQLLEGSGFERLPKPLLVAGTTFDFDAAVKGTGVSHDLVIVATSATTPRRLAQLLSGLSRTLDQVQSRRPVSLVLLGQHSTAATMADLERHARVMTIDSESPNDDEVRRAVAVLLPLSLPSTTRQGREPLDEVAATLGVRLSDEHQSLINKAKVGPEAVREALRNYIDSGARDEATGGNP